MSASMFACIALFYVMGVTDGGAASAMTVGALLSIPLFPILLPKLVWTVRVHRGGISFVWRGRLKGVLPWAPVETITSIPEESGQRGVTVRIAGGRRIGISDYVYDGIEQVLEALHEHSGRRF